MTRLTNTIIERQPFPSDGNSGNPLESVTLADGQRLLLKRVSPEWDWMARESHDDGRIGWLWENGVLGRVPPVIDHTIVGVERDGQAWNVFMRDVSAVLTSRDARFDRTAVRSILAAAAELHETFWGEDFPELCGLVDRYSLFSPATGYRELELGSRHGIVFTRGWDAFFELAPADIGEAISAILRRPTLLAEQLDNCQQTLIHGDLRLGNLGIAKDKMVLIDWGERVGSAPPAVELGWFLGFDALRLDVSKDDVIEDFRSIYGDRLEEAALQMSLIGSLVQIGGLLGFWIVNAKDDGARAMRKAELAWWAATVERALHVWSPI